jgi:hypothetical protein
LYIGDGVGAICGGSAISIAYLRGNDPKEAAEPQLSGLDFLGRQ